MNPSKMRLVDQVWAKFHLVLPFVLFPESYDIFVFEHGLRAVLCCRHLGVPLAILMSTSNGEHSQFSGPYTNFRTAAMKQNKIFIKKWKDFVYVTITCVMFLIF